MGKNIIFPNDKEIEHEAIRYAIDKFGHRDEDTERGFQIGAKWIRDFTKNCPNPVPEIEESVNGFSREQLARDILIALLSNPERYKYITKEVENGRLTQEEANIKNIDKAFRIADSFLMKVNNYIKE